MQYLIKFTILFVYGTPCALFDLWPCSSFYKYFFLDGKQLLLFLMCRNHRGLRHYWGLRVRGQHTKTTGRRGKTVGVSKKRWAYFIPFWDGVFLLRILFCFLGYHGFSIVLFFLVDSCSIIEVVFLCSLDCLILFEEILVCDGINHS